MVKVQMCFSNLRTIAWREKRWDEAIQIIRFIAFMRKWLNLIIGSIFFPTLLISSSDYFQCKQTHTQTHTHFFRGSAIIISNRHSAAVCVQIVYFSSLIAYFFEPMSLCNFLPLDYIGIMISFVHKSYSTFRRYQVQLILLSFVGSQGVNGNWELKKNYFLPWLLHLHITQGK